MLVGVPMDHDARVAATGAGTSQTASLMELDFDPLTAFDSHACELRGRGT